MNAKGLIFLITGAIFECVWAYGLKHAEGAAEISTTIVSILGSFAFFMLAIRHVAVSVAYVVFTGLGTLLVVLIEMADTLSHGGDVAVLRVVFVITLMLGVIGVKGAKS